MMPSSCMNRTLLILKIPSLLLTKSRNLPRFITVSGSLLVILKPILSSQEAILGGFMIQNFVIPAEMSPKLTIYTLSFEEFLMAYDQNPV